LGVLQRQPWQWYSMQYSRYVAVQYSKSSNVYLVALYSGEGAVAMTIRATDGSNEERIQVDQVHIVFVLLYI
jgi:hypothetical protein